ncbi:DNA-binding Xre family transcriptional regulator [Sporomusaceae bacterium BoRhaA]|uniref:helix-turn-helix domain-containing protein n=1 Tax=Pelorhabdus rhamnosifermentans TaxID=2772457 RepID=UPI001C0618A0|nr:helix-turn-helix transcriptional regulator [Pelorhabdus rhamnosifermentans]MBU2699960.1 DNA-binding Xre family transcriptional regulator [Pelorhabdus rhamnosifermentans]
MSISYKRLFHLLIDKGIKDSDLRKLSGISAPTMAKLKQDKVVQTDIISKVCAALNCQPGDIMEYIPEQKDEGK